jgi:heme-degrading monooxygenase HmoA
MIEILYRYRVHPSQARAFEHAYGSSGPWVALFRDNPGYRRTRLFRHNAETGVYICIDVWESKADFDSFRSTQAEAYARLDREFRLLYLEELFLGYYEGEEEYGVQLDSMT